MDTEYMRQALKLAEKAYSMGEIPVGAVIVRNGEIIGSGFNCCEREKNPLRHAEMMAIDEACRNSGDKFLDDCDMYVTLEPCCMCAGAIINARIRRLYFGAFEPATGACGSTVNLFLSTDAYKKTDVFPGVLGGECRRLMTDFFRKELR